MRLMMQQCQERSLVLGNVGASVKLGGQETRGGSAVVGASIQGRGGGRNGSVSSASTRVSDELC